MSRRLRHARRRDRAAFSLVEVVVSSGIVSVVGGLVVACLLAGIQIFGKNVAANLPFQGSRVAFDLLQSDLHSAVGDPVLIDAAFQPVAGSGPAPGVAVRLQTGGPCVVALDAGPAASTLEVEAAPGAAPQVGDLLSLPAFRIERTITAVSTASGRWILGLDAPLGATLDAAATENYACFFSRRCGYLVSGGALRRYADLGNPAVFKVVTRGVTAATPFAFPLNGTVPDRRSLITQLTALDPGSSNRGWRTVGANLNFTLGVRATSPATMQ